MKTEIVAEVYFLHLALKCYALCQQDIFQSNMLLIKKKALEMQNTFNTITSFIRGIGYIQMFILGLYKSHTH